MSKKPAAIPLFGDAYLADTTHLTTEEHGAYLLLIMAAWRQDDCALPLDDRKLARIVGLSMRKWIAIRPTILEFWTVESGRIYQRRLSKERAYVDQKSESNRKNAVARWDAQAIENKQTTPMPPQCQTDAPPPPPPQERKEPKGSSASGDAPLAVDEVLEGWNILAAKHGLSQVRKLTDQRRRKVTAQARRFPVPDWQSVFGKISQSPFLRGENRQGWRCDFDFILSEGNFVKILEGKYDQQ